MEMKQTSKSFDELFPLMGMKDGIIISKRGDVTLGWELTLPDIYSLLESEYDEMLSSLASAVRILPAWTMVHRQDIYLYDSYRPQLRGAFLPDSYERHFEGRRYLTHRQYLYLTMTTKGSAQRPVSGSGLYGAKAIRKLPSAERLRQLSSKASEFLSVLTGGGRISARRLTSDDFASAMNDGIIPTYLRLGDRSGIFSDYPMSPDHVRIGDRNLWAFTLSESEDLPTELSTTQRVESLSGSASELFLSMGAAIGPLLDTEQIVSTTRKNLPRSRIRQPPLIFQSIIILRTLRNRLLPAQNDAENVPVRRERITESGPHPVPGKRPSPGCVSSGSSEPDNKNLCRAYRSAEPDRRYPCAKSSRTVPRYPFRR